MASQHKHYFPEEKSGICVVKRKNESFEDLMKRFRKKYSKGGLSRELRERMFFEKPSNKKRRKKNQSIRAIQKQEEKLSKFKEKVKKTKKREKRRADKDDSRSRSRQNYSEKTYEN